MKLLIVKLFDRILKNEYDIPLIKNILIDLNCSINVQNDIICLVECNNKKHFIECVLKLVEYSNNKYVDSFYYVDFNENEYLKFKNKSFIVEFGQADEFEKYKSLSFSKEYSHSISSNLITKRIYTEQEIKKCFN
jgi:hypothetical protein